MSHTTKSLALSFVRSRGIATIMLIDQYVRENSAEPPPLDEVFAVMSDLVKERAVTLLDAEDYTFGPSVVTEDATEGVSP